MAIQHIEFKFPHLPPQIVRVEAISSITLVPFVGVAGDIENQLIIKIENDNSISYSGTDSKAYYDALLKWLNPSVLAL